MAKILIVDDEVRIRELLRKALSREGLEVASVPSAAQAMEIIFKEPFDLLLLDVRLAGESGLSVLKKAREYRQDVPIIIYSGALTSELEQEARVAGANEVLSKDMDISQLVARIKAMVKTKERILQVPVEPGKKALLIIDDEEEIRRVLSEYFKRKGFNVFEAESGEQALQLIRSEKVSIVLLDMRMPGLDGLETLEKILEINPKLGVVMATAEQNDQKIERALELAVMSKLTLTDGSLD